MKLQYLGDSKDAFKWDYLDFLAKGMNTPALNVVLMKTPDDKSEEGKTSSMLFPSSDEIQNFCRDLRENQDFCFLSQLPNYTGGKYAVCLHKEDNYFVNASASRAEYFSGIKSAANDIVFLDPDIGFEPPKGGNVKHVKYSDMRDIYDGAHQDAVILVFQHARQMHMPFNEHYREIKSRLDKEISCHITALFWCNSLMFIVIGKSAAQIGRVRALNACYQKLPRPVQLISGNGV